MLVLLALAVALILRGGGDGGSSVRHRQLRAAISKAMLTNRAGDCTQLYTQRFLDQTEGRRGRKAVQKCRREADGESIAKHIAITRLSVHGDAAAATLTVIAGETDGSVVGLRLVRGPVEWKLDRLTRFEIDRPKFIAAQHAAVMDAGWGAKKADCYARGLRRIKTSALEKSVLDGSSEALQAPINRICFDAAAVRRMFLRELRTSPSMRKLPAAVRQCIVKKLALIPARALRRAVSAGSRSVGRLGRSAAIVCASEIYSGSPPPV